MQPPKWPSQIFPNDEAWKIDPARVSKGRAIYAEICAECHLGPVNDPAFDTQYPEKSFWSSPQWDAKGQVLDPVQKTVAGMGTDPAQGNVLFTRMVEVPGFLEMEPAQDLGQKVGMHELADLPFNGNAVLDRADDRGGPQQPEMDGRSQRAGRSNRPALWEIPERIVPIRSSRSVPHYRARPLNGVWATAPYLHNGSVPSLYWLLKPAAERPKQFCMGSRDFDPQQVGFRVNAERSTELQQGRNLVLDYGIGPIGDQWQQRPRPLAGGNAGSGQAGVIGRLLTDEERFDLIEYLKTL